MTGSRDARKETRDGVDKRQPHSDGHLGQDQSGLVAGRPGQGGTGNQPARSGQHSEDPTPETDDQS